MHTRPPYVRQPRGRPASPRRSALGRKPPRGGYAAEQDVRSHGWPGGCCGRQEENAGWAHRGATRKARKARPARRAWCEPSERIGRGHRSGATSFCSQEAPQGPCALRTPAAEEPVQRLWWWWPLRAPASAEFMQRLRRQQLLRTSTAKEHV